MVYGHPKKELKILVFQNQQVSLKNEHYSSKNQQHLHFDMLNYLFDLFETEYMQLITNYKNIVFVGDFKARTAEEKDIFGRL
jgi:hypothetical protein